MINVGTQVTIIATIKDEHGELKDPSTFSIEIKSPTNKKTTISESPSLTNPSTGVYKYAFVPDEIGLWFFKVSTSNPTVVNSVSIMVYDS